MDMDLMTWVGAAVACTFVILLAVVILGGRIDKVSEQLIDLRLLQINMQPVDNDQGRVLSALASLAEALPDLRSLKKEIEEVKRQHADLSARMEAVAQAHGELLAIAGALEEIRSSWSELSARMQVAAQTNGELHTVAGALEEIRTSQSESMKAVGGMANLIRQWCYGLNTAAAEVERSVRSVTPVIPIDAPAREQR